MVIESIGNQDSILVLQYKPDFVDTIQSLVRLPNQSVYLATSNHDLIETFTKSIANPFGIFSKAIFRCILIDFSSNYSKASSEISEIQDAFEVLPPAAGVFLPTDYSQLADTGFSFLSQKFCLPIKGDELDLWIAKHLDTINNANFANLTPDPSVIAIEGVPILNNDVYQRLEILAKSQNYPLSILLNSYSLEMGAFIRKLAMNVSIGKREEAQWIILSIKSLSRVIGAEQISILATFIEVMLKQPNWKQVLTHIPDLHFALKIFKDEVASRVGGQ